MFDIDTPEGGSYGLFTGTGRDTTPVMDSVAEEGVCFDPLLLSHAPACLRHR